MRNTPENSLAASILPGKDEEKMIKDVRLTLPSVILSLKLIGPKMMRITVAYLLARNLARKAVNICKASEASNFFSRIQKHGQPSKENSRENNLDIFEEISIEKMTMEELGPSISNSLAEVTMKYWSKEPKNPVMVIKIYDDLKIPGNSSSIHRGVARIFLKDT